MHCLPAPRKSSPLWKEQHDLYLLSGSGYAATLSPPELVAAVSVVRWWYKQARKERRQFHWHQRGYFYQSMCMDEMQAFLQEAIPLLPISLPN